MPKFVTIGYGDQNGYDLTPKAVRDAAHAHDAELQASGVLMGMAGVPVQVRNPDAKITVTREGPFMSASLPVAGFAVIEAATLQEAVEMVSRTPCAVAHGVVEVWPPQGNSLLDYLVTGCQVGCETPADGTGSIGSGMVIGVADAASGHRHDPCLTNPTSLTPIP